MSDWSSYSWPFQMLLYSLSSNNFSYFIVIQKIIIVVFHCGLNHLFLISYTQWDLKNIKTYFKLIIGIFPINVDKNVKAQKVWKFNIRYLKKKYI